MIVSISSHQNPAGEMRREIRRIITAVVDRTIKVMVHARRDVDFSLFNASIFLAVDVQISI